MKLIFFLAEQPHISSWLVCKICSKPAIKASCSSSDLCVYVPLLFSKHMVSMSLLESIHREHTVFCMHWQTPYHNSKLPPSSLICQQILTSLTSQILYFLCPNHRTGAALCTIIIRSKEKNRNGRMNWPLPLPVLFVQVNKTASWSLVPCLQLAQIVKTLPSQTTSIVVHKWKIST